MKSKRLPNIKGFYQKLLGLLLTTLIFPAFILAQEPEGILFTGLSTDSTDTSEQEVLEQGIAKTFNVRMVWTYDQTNLITGPLETLSAAKNIATPTNGLEEPLLSQSSGYQKKVIAHSAGVTTAVTLAKQGKLWGDELYFVSTALISQDDLRQIRDLTSQGKGFNKIVLYTGDDIIPNFKEIQINLKDYTIQAKITEDSEVSLTKVVYEDRGQNIDILKLVLNDFVTRIQEQLGKEPLSIAIYGDIPGNKIEITWKDGTRESFNLQKDSQTGEDFQEEANIKIVPLYDGFPHGRLQLEILEEFYKKYVKMPQNTEDDIKYFKGLVKLVKKVLSENTTPHDPNIKYGPEGNVSPGQKLNYKVEYANEGEGIAFGVYFTDTLDEDLNDSTLEIGPVLDVKTGIQIAPAGTYNPQTRTITWLVGKVDSKQGGYAEFSVNVKNDASDGAEIINYATVYFPSVFEETRTNGIVSKVTTVIDKTPPTTTAIISPSANSVGWNNTNVDITLSAVDNEAGSGLAKTEYSFDDINWITYVSSFTITAEGTTAVYYKSTDNAGNIESAKSLVIKIDKTLPTITATISPEPNSNGWNNTDVTVSFTATDVLSGIASVTGPISVTAKRKDQLIGGEAIDLAGNKATAYVTLNIDKTPPTVTIAASPNILWPPNHKLVDVNIGGEATDDISGIASTTFNVEDEYNSVEPVISDFGSVIKLESWREGNDKDGRVYTVYVTTKDKAGNQASSSTIVTCPHDQRKR